MRSKEELDKIEFEAVARELKLMSANLGFTKNDIKTRGSKMSILGLAFTAADLKTLMQRHSTKVHELYHEIKYINSQLNQISNEDLQQIFELGETNNAAEDVASFKSWQSALNGFADNYVGQGEISDKSYELAKRVKLPL